VSRNLATDRVAWTVGLSVGLSPSEPRKTAEAIEMQFASDLGGPREAPITYSGPLRANTVLGSFDTIQPLKPYYNKNVKNCRFVTTCKAHN